MDIVSWTFANGGYDQDLPIYIDSSDTARYVSARQCRQQVRQLIAGFNHHGLIRGDCVCVISFNDIQYTSLYLGIVGAGGIFTGANPGYTARELAHHLRITQTRFIIAQTAMITIAVAAADECGIPHSSIFVFDSQESHVTEECQSWRTLLSHGEASWIAVEDPNNTTAAYFSTSGTSGLPKAAVVSHSYLTSQGEIQAKTVSGSDKPSYLIALPPFHAYVFQIQHALPLRKGIPVYVMPRYEPTKFLSAIEQFQINRIPIVPPILVSMSKSSLCTKNTLKSLRRIYVAGSITKKEMQQQVYKLISPAARIENLYGMTESGWTASTWSNRKRDQTGSIGKPLPGMDLRLADLDGNLIREDNVNGEIQIHSANLMRSYLNNPTATAEAFTPDGWVRSGDIGYVQNGQYYIVDRTKDLIKVRGWQVSPAEIECALLEHPDIIDAGVIAIPATDDSGSGELPQAFVVKRPLSATASTLDEHAVKDFLAGRLARYKQVAKVEFVDVIPRNPTGKILRRVLREALQVQKEVARKDDPKIDSVQRKDQQTQTAASDLFSDEEVALAYSKALRELEESRKRRGSKCGVCNRHARSLSGSSASSASTVETAGPTTPTDVVPEPNLLNPKKRPYGGHVEAAPAKRRNTRASVAKDGN